MPHCSERLFPVATLDFCLGQTLVLPDWALSNDVIQIAICSCLFEILLLKGLLEGGEAIIYDLIENLFDVK